MPLGAPGEVRVRVVRLAGAGTLPLPSYATSGAAGADIVAALDAPLCLAPGERALVPTGFSLALPDGYEGQIRPRSGRAARDGLTLLNGPGTLDADYRGEIRILVVNHGSEPLTLRRGERIAQLVVAPVIRAAFEEAEQLSPTLRGDGGFGHTGL